MKAGGVGRGERKTSPQLPQRCRRTDGQRKSRVHVANALANCEPPTPPDVACQLTQEGERDRDRKIERREEGWGGGLD